MIKACVEFAEKNLRHSIFACAHALVDSKDFTISSRSIRGQERTTTLSEVLPPTWSLGRVTADLEFGWMKVSTKVAHR